MTLSLLMPKQLTYGVSPTLTSPIRSDDYSHYFPIETQVFVAEGFYPVEQGQWISLDTSWLDA